MNDLYELDIIKMSHVGVIQQLNKYLGIKQEFKTLWNMNLKELEELRDNLIPKYNEALKNRQFASDMIYKRGTKK